MSAAGTVGVFTTDLALVVRSWDAWIAEATGVSEQEASGRPLAELFPELEARGLLARLRRVAGSGSVEVLAPAFHEYLLPCPPRVPSARFARMQQHVTIAPLRAGEEVAGVTVTIEDVTARRERERDLAAQLQSADDTVRLRAVRALSAEDAPAAPLATALGDRSWRVRRAAAEGLAHAVDHSALDVLLATLRERHRDPAALNAALQALVLARQDVVPPLLDLLDHTTEADLRTYAALALGLLEDRRAVPALVRALDDADPNVRFHAVEAIGRIRSRAAALPVAAVAESRDFSVAFAALDTLAAIGEPSVGPRIVPLLEDGLLQDAAADALGRLGAEDVVGPLAARLDDDGVPAAAVARALAALHARFAARDAADEGTPGGEEGALVVDLARAVTTPAGARRLADALATAGDEDRASVATVLGWVGGEGTERALAAQLAHPAARRAAAEALARRGGAAVPALLDALAGDDDAQRVAAAAALGRTGTASAVPALVAALDDSSEMTVVASGALGRIGDPGATDALLARLDDPHAAVRQAAVAALSSIGHPALRERVRALAAHPSPRVREAAARLAGYGGWSSLVEPMLALCRDPDDMVRQAAVEQIVHFDDPRATRAVAAALDTGTPGERAAAARALSHVPPDEALPRLLALCHDRDPWVRYYAARAAGHHRRADAVPGLVALATTDGAPPVRIAAVEAVVEIGAADGCAALRPLGRDPDAAVAHPALLALGQSSDPADLPVLLDALDADDAGRRSAALDALARRRERGAVDAVERIARADADPETRARAARALARIGGERAVDALVRLAEEPQRTAEAVDALARLAAEQAPWVARGLTHPDLAVRCAVVEALGRMRQAVPLAEALRDDAPAVRLAAERALGRIDLRAARETPRRAAAAG